jgi:putative NIF3 family GTP cyclohydrolase 1 type 2
VTAKEVERIVLDIAPLENGIEGDPNGLLYGDPETEVTGIATTWTPTVAVLREAACDGLNFVLTHEIPFFGGGETEWFRTLPEEDKPHNIARKKILDENRMVVCRCHSNWDASPGGVMESCAEALGFADVHYRHPYCTTYNIEPTTLAQLAAHAKQALGVPLVRVAGDTGMTVRRVTLHYGGLAQRWLAIDEAVVAGADAIICGEALDYTLRAAIDAGIGFIETSHVYSENPGMRNFAQLLGERLPGLPVRFINAGMPWVHL